MVLIMILTAMQFTEKDGKDKGSYITIDLGQQCRINNVNLWRYWTDGRTYKANRTGSI